METVLESVLESQGVLESGLDTVGGSLVGIWKSKARSSIILLCLAMVLCQVVSQILFVTGLLFSILMLMCCCVYSS